jgi:hypothetical protein
MPSISTSTDARAKILLSFTGLGGGDVSELPRLLRHRLGDFGAAMADINDIELGETVEIGVVLPAAVFIPRL